MRKPCQGRQSLSFMRCHTPTLVCSYFLFKQSTTAELPATATATARTVSDPSSSLGLQLCACMYMLKKPNTWALGGWFNSGDLGKRNALDTFLITVTKYQIKQLKDRKAWPWLTGSQALSGKLWQRLTLGACGWGSSHLGGRQGA